MRFLCATALFLPSLAPAQDPTPTSEERFVRGAFGVDFTNQYFFRGLQQENQGLIAQPWLELGYDLYDGEPGDGLHDLGLTFGLWNSLHEGPTGSGGGVRNGRDQGIWYESDFYVDLRAGLGERLELSTRYTAYHSPNGFFNPPSNNPQVPNPDGRRGFRTTVEELSFALAYDDEGLLPDVVRGGFQPHVLLAFELDGQRDNGNQVGSYLEVGVTPTFPLDEENGKGMTLSVPTRLGFSLSDYYEDATNGGRDEAFGFLSVGAAFATPLQFLPHRVGPWHAEVAVHWLVLGDNLEERNDGDSSELYLTAGLSTRF